MANAFDNVTSGASSTGTSRTFSHTFTGTNGMIFVDVASSAGDTITGVTCNGSPMTQVAKIKQGGVTQFAYTYAIVNPSAGANSIVVSSSVSSSIYTTATSYTGVSQTTTFDAVATSSISLAPGNLSTTLSTTVANCWTRCWSINDTNIFSAWSDTIRGTNNGANSFDTNGPITSAGSKTMTQTVSGSINSCSIMISFAPSVSSSGAFMLFMK